MKDIKEKKKLRKCEIWKFAVWITPLLDIVWESLKYFLHITEHDSNFLHITERDMTVTFDRIIFFLLITD